MQSHNTISVFIAVRRILCFFFVLFLAFPYLKIIPMSGYNQPYALLLAGLVAPLALWYFIRHAPAWHVLSLILFVVVGITLFLLTCFPYTSFQEYKYLYTYIGFPIVAVGSVYFICHERELVIKILEVSVYVWLLVALVQAVYKPDFLTVLIGLPSEIAGDVLVSGRGFVSLAPEPTHYGFHLLVLGGVLAMLGGRALTLLLCVVQAVFFAKSASAVMALVVGVAFMLIASRKLNLRNIFLIVFVSTVFSFLLYEYAGQSRVVSLVSGFIGAPAEVLSHDYSLNIRLGGLLASFVYVLESWFMPFGLSHSVWLESSEQILTGNEWLMGLSQVGVPSGVVIILYQAGFLLLLPVLYILMTFFSVPIKGVRATLVYTIPLIVLAQYYIASPPFALAYAAALLSRYYVVGAEPKLCFQGRQDSVGVI